MDDARRDQSPDSEPNPLEELLKSMLGPEAASEAMRTFQSQGFDASAMMGQLGSPAQINMAMQQLRYLMQHSDGPVNWRLVEDFSRQHAYQSGDPELMATQAGQVKQALSVADLWLDPLTDFSIPGVTREAWTRVEWIDKTLPAWKKICEPVAANASRALVEAMHEELGDGAEISLPEGMSQLAGSITTMMPQMAAMMFGTQVAQALAALSQESFGSSDAGIPLTGKSETALVWANVESFSDGLEIPTDEILQYLAARECAHARLFAAVPWLEHDLLTAVQRYAQEIAIDTAAIAEAARSINPQDPASLNQALGDGVFAVSPTEAQTRALERLETLLALIEGWVEVVVSEAVAPYLPHADQLREMIRRRRVSGSAGEQMLTQLVGLSLRPRRARNAARLFTNVQEQKGPQGRDALWAHPDMIPTAAEIDEPDSFLRLRDEQESQTSDIDLALTQLLEGTLGWAEGLSPNDDPESSILHPPSSAEGDSDDENGPEDSSDGSASTPQ